MQPLPFVVLIFPYPPIKVMAIVVINGVSKDTMELSIHSCEDLQERVVGLKLILHPRHGRSVGIQIDSGGLSPSPLTVFPGGYRHPCISVAHGCRHCVLRRSLWHSLEASQTIRLTCRLTNQPTIQLTAQPTN
jgi:hypothetical protein